MARTNREKLEKNKQREGTKEIVTSRNIRMLADTVRIFFFPGLQVCVLNTADFNAGELALEGEPTSYNAVECGRQTEREREREKLC